MRSVRACYVVPLLLALGCGGGSFAEKAQHSLATALVATNQARAVFVAYDLEHQKSLVADASGDAELAASKVAAYREKRQAVTRAFTVAYSAIATASLGLAAAKTQAEQLDVSALIADAVAATLEVKQALSALFPKKDGG